MKFVRNFICLLSVAGLFLMMGCSNSVVDSTDISINFNISALKSKTSKVMQNAGSIRALSETESSEVIEAWNTAKLCVALYEVKSAENIPSDYESFDKSLYKEISFSSCYADESGNMTVTLSAVPIGIKAIIVAEISDEQADIQSVEFAGLSNVFEVSDGTNVVELELESCVIDEPVFTLEYKTQTGIVISTQENIKAGTSILLPKTINLDELGIKGFGKFLGFYTDSDFTGNPITSVVVDKDITLYAKFEIIDYSITYVIDGATWNSYTPNSSYNVLDAAISYIPKGEDLEKVGYTFEGWYKDADYTEKITSLVGLFEDITLYAKWEVINYSIKYELNGGAWADIYRPFTYYTVEGITYLPSGNNLIKEEFVFEGWYDNPEYTGKAIDSLVGRTGDLTVYAKWRDENQVATVQFSHAAGGVDMATEIKLTCETDGATIYYTIDGSDPAENYSVYTPEKPIYIDDILSDEQEEVTIKAYAVCEGMKESSVSTITYTLNVYTLNFDANGGTLPRDMQSSVEVISGNSYDFANFVPTKEGCIFKGWYLSETPDEFVTNYEPNIENTPTKTVTIYAKWENTATITVTMPTYSDIQGLEKPTDNENGGLTFTVPEGVTYTHNIWYVNGEEKQQNTGSTNKWTFNTTNLPGGIYTIMLVVVDSNGNKYSAEYQVTVTK